MPLTMSSVAMAANLASGTENTNCVVAPLGEEARRLVQRLRGPALHGGLPLLSRRCR